MKRTIAIAANFTIEPIADSARRFISKLGIEYELEFAPFDQVFQQLIDPSSLFHGNERGINAVFLRVEGLFADSTAGDFTQGRANVADLKKALGRAADLRSPVFLFLCAPSQSAFDDLDLRSEIEAAESEMASLADVVSNLYVFGYKDVVGRHRIEAYDNPVGNALADMPYTESYYAAVGVELVRRSDAAFRKPFKVLVLDCDNTLWDGVCGEDGTHGIAFPEYRLALHRFANRQREAGMVVCLCTKNNEADVWDVFDQRSEILLRREQLVSWRINWEPKSMNLRSLSEELQLGLDSFVFIDDDPAVCAEVEANCPEVCTLLLPGERERIPDFLDHVWLFDRLRVTDEDKDRSESYKREVARRSVQRDSADLEGFLESLQLVCRIGEIEPEQIPRVSQLSLRTNQFNSTTRRRTESDIQQLISDGRTILTVNVHDRFGDYGLVGVVVCNPTQESLYVDSFMLSCRALGRGVEHQILRQLGAIATEQNRECVEVEFIRSQKNAPFENFIKDIGAETADGGSEATRYRITSADALQARPRAKAVASVAASSVTNESSGQESDFNWKPYLRIAYELLDESALVVKGESRVLDRALIATPLVDPRTDTERKVASIWREHLRLEDVGVLDNFFEIGGDSLLAVSIFVDIEESFKKTLPLSVLIGSPTIESLASHIDGESNAMDWKYLVPIQEQGTERALFCMHAAGGNVLFYRDLAKELGKDQPVYGLQARGVADKSETAHDRVEDMAAAYLAEIRSFQPKGPYRVCGSSFGGLVAFEVARQLTAAGEHVELVALFDTYAPGLVKGAVEKQLKNPLLRSLERVRNTLTKLTSLSSNQERIQFFRNNAKKLSTQLKRKALWKRNQFALQYSKATGKTLPVDLQRNHKAIDKARETYRPSPYNGEIVLFRAKDQPVAMAHHSRLGWDQLTTEPIEVIEVPGAHGALTMYPFASDLAANLRPFLTTAERSTEQRERKTAVAFA